MASAHGLPCDRAPAGGGRVAFTVHTGFFLFINLRVTDGRNGKNSAAHDRPRRPLDRCGRKRRRSRYDTHSVHYREPEEDNTSMSPPIVFKDVAPVVPVRNLQAALERYRQLGFEVRAYGHGTGYGYAQRGAVSIHLSEWDEHDPKRTGAVVYLYVSDADAVRAEWARCGAQGRLGEPRNTDYGMREFGFVDSDGTLHRVGSKLP